MGFGLTTNFDVEIDALPFIGGLGQYVSVDGIGYEMQIEDRQEGGTLTHKLKIPGQVTHSTIKVTRVVDSHSPQVMLWFGLAINQIIPTTVVVTLFGPGRKDQVAQWIFNKAVPKRYSLGGFNISGVKVATETMEFDHHGPLGGLLGGAGGAAGAVVGAVAGAAAGAALGSIGLKGGKSI